jgi:hypothetical protein
VTDDIVTRLRFALENFRNDPQPVLLEDAADEIERLRAEVAVWKNVAQEITMYAAMQELIKAANL